MIPEAVFTYCRGQTSTREGSWAQDVAESSYPRILGTAKKAAAAALEN